MKAMLFSYSPVLPVFRTRSSRYGDDRGQPLSASRRSLWAIDQTLLQPVQLPCTCTVPVAWFDELLLVGVGVIVRSKVPVDPPSDTVTVPPLLAQEFDPLAVDKRTDALVEDAG